MIPEAHRPTGWDDDLWEAPPPEDRPAPAPGVTAPDATALAQGRPEERRRLLGAYLREELARVLRVDPGAVHTTGRTLGSIGVGSITGLELQQRIRHALHLDVALPRILGAADADALADHLADRLAGQYAAAAAA
ncbi:acyl carrier protein [Streptomyces sp. NPDC050738]|uniref:acyl carrier protein n=1 Tax=Streptomyces sp. NPDC050738 TaxID=3154744 RepID=UPI00343DFD92